MLITLSGKNVTRSLGELLLMSPPGGLRYSPYSLPAGPAALQPCSTAAPQISGQLQQLQQSQGSLIAPSLSLPLLQGSVLPQGLFMLPAAKQVKLKNLSKRKKIFVNVEKSF